MNGHGENQSIVPTSILCNPNVVHKSPSYLDAIWLNYDNQTICPQHGGPNECQSLRKFTNAAYHQATAEYPRHGRRVLASDTCIGSLRIMPHSERRSLWSRRLKCVRGAKRRSLSSSSDSFARCGPVPASAAGSLDDARIYLQSVASNNACAQLWSKFGLTMIPSRTSSCTSFILPYQAWLH